MDIELIYSVGTGVTLTKGQVDSNFKTIQTAFANLAVPGTGTVTSVGLLLPSNDFTITNSPVTATGTLTAAWKTKVANTILAGPSTGADAAPTFRTLVAADLPTVTIAKGGLNLTSAITSGDVLSYNGSVYLGRTLTSANNKQTISVGATAITFTINEANLVISNMSGTLGQANGGTGVTTASANQILLGNGTGFNLRVLTAGSGVTLTDNGTLLTVAASGGGAIPTFNGLTGALTLALGTANNDLTITPSGTTITLDVPTASGTKRGALSTTDWTTFNNKLSGTLTDAHIFVGSGANVATDVAVTGDVTISNTGVTAIGNLKVTNAMIAAATINLTTKVTGVLPSANKYEAFQIHTTGATVTIAANKSGLVVDVNPGIAALTITFPASPNDLDIITLLFGGSIAPGAGDVVTALTLNGNGNIIFNALTGAASAATYAQYQYRASITTWYRIA